MPGDGRSGTKLKHCDIDTAVGYTGHQHDRETGLTYAQARYYDAAVGRFLSADPIDFTGAPQSFNRYGYANNNPYRYTDPTGETASLVAPAVVEAIVITGAVIAATPLVIDAVDALAGAITQASDALSDAMTAESSQSDDGGDVGSDEEAPELPSEITGNNPAQGSGNRINTDLPGEPEGVFDRLSGETSREDKGQRVAPNGVRLRSEKKRKAKAGESTFQPMD